jgi:Cu2+-exporting ATPase
MDQTLHNQYFHVDGIRCARCIHAIESALQSEDAVEEARVNMSTNRLSIRWRGSESLAVEFAEKIRALGYGVKPYDAPAKTSSESRYLLRCMAIAGFAMGNIMLLSAALWSSEQSIMGLATRDLLHWLSALIALPAIAYAGRPFFHSALGVLKKGHTNMDVPISLALILACGMSLFETINHGEHAYFDSAVMLLFFLLIGRWLDAHARGKARENATALLAMMQGYATVIKDGEPHSLPISQLQEGIVLRIVSGEKVPTDCEIMEGRAEIDTSLITGETVPRLFAQGETLYGGTLNLSGSLTCRVLKASEDSLLADIIRLMEQAEQGRAHYVRLADKAAKLYTPVVHSLAALAFLGWYAVGGVAWQEALLIAITTLIITCPCALGLAVPVVQVLASSWLMKRGILLKSGDALERLATINHAVFDKTGTLTLGKPELVGEYSQADLHIAASLASHSKHPYSQAIAAAYSGELLALEDIKEVPGNGLEGRLDGTSYRLGSGAWCGADAGELQGPHIWLKQGQNPPTPFLFEDRVREGAAEVITKLQAQNISCQLLSGDHLSVVKPLAGKLNITNYAAQQLPEQKTQTIKQLQAEGANVLMVGDGLNDAPSLAQADISISPASGMDITQNTADIVFQEPSLSSVWRAWRMACFSTRLVKQNFSLAVLYNIIAIPIALAGMVTPMIAAIAMSLSSLIVILNSFRINRVKE